MNEQTITETFRKLYKARQDLFQANERLLAARQAIEGERAKRLLQGDISGKNEAERDARTRELLEQWYTTLEGAEQEERHARLAHDLAKLEVERLDFLLRLMALPKE